VRGVNSQVFAHLLRYDLEASTLVEAQSLIAPQLLIEIEADVIIASAD